MPTSKVSVNLRAFFRGEQVSGEDEDRIDRRGGPSAHASRVINLPCVGREGARRDGSHASYSPSLSHLPTIPMQLIVVSEYWQGWFQRAAA